MSKDESTVPVNLASKPVKTLTPFNDTQTLTKSEQALRDRLEALDKAVSGFIEGDESISPARRALYTTLVEGLSATRVIMEECNGQLEVREVPDKLVRHKYMETGLKMIGDLVEVKTEVNVDASSKTLQITAVESEELERLRGSIHGSNNE